MEPLANNPSSKLGVGGYESISASVHKATGTIASSDCDRFPASIVRVSRLSVRAEWECVGVELEVCTVEIGGRTVRCEDRVCQSSACVVGFDCGRLDVC